eukprot:TRINITY_DN9791_c0_g1_i2.p1 TRINITY_DN9791_c0_g1~~TRINITY_DN9791_c0_g1_i2.p1  ORF type:complete len:236 (+),score=19.91 TRINITY_DN9791_c0_g1_i2:61-708(+)
MCIRDRYMGHIATLDTYYTYFLTGLQLLFILMILVPLWKKYEQTELLIDYFLECSLKDAINFIAFFLFFTGVINPLDAATGFRISGHTFLYTLTTSCLIGTLVFIENKNIERQHPGISPIILAWKLCAAFVILYSFYCQFFTILYFHSILECLVSFVVSIGLILVVYPLNKLPQLLRRKLEAGTKKEEPMQELKLIKQLIFLYFASGFKLSLIHI